MTLKQKMDVLDMIINVLREHEGNLDSLGFKLNILMERLESLCQEMEQNITEDESEPIQDLAFETSIIIDLLEDNAFSNPYFSFASNLSSQGDNKLIDHIHNRTLVFGKSTVRSNIPLWNILVFQVTEEPYGEPSESHYFNTERMMLAWIIKYLLEKI